MEINRDFLKSYMIEKYPEVETDQKKEIPAPPLQKEYSSDQELIELPDPGECKAPEERSIMDVIDKRRSHRKFSEEPLTIEELSFLLWSTQAMEKDNERLRKVPSGGARHPFETYIYVRKVDELTPAIYRYLPKEHALVLHQEVDNTTRKDRKLTAACLGQKFVARAAVAFIWTAIPYRTEWRYGPAAYKLIAQDSGHLCQNLYLASEAIKAGTCGIGAYSQERIDDFIDVDGEDEFVLYLAPVGKQ